MSCPDVKKLKRRTFIVGTGASLVAGAVGLPVAYGQQQKKPESIPEPTNYVFANDRIRQPAEVYDEPRADASPKIIIDGFDNDWPSDARFYENKEGNKGLKIWNNSEWAYFLFSDPNLKEIKPCCHYANLAVKPRPSVEVDVNHPPFLICFNLGQHLSSLTYWDYAAQKWIDVSGYDMGIHRGIPPEDWSINPYYDYTTHGTKVEVRYRLRGDTEKGLPAIIIDEDAASFYASIEPQGPDQYPIFKNNVFSPPTFKKIDIPEFSNLLLTLGGAALAAKALVSFRGRKL